MHQRVVFIVLLFIFVSVDGFGFETTTCGCPKPVPTCPPPPPPPVPCPPPPLYQPCPPAPEYIPSPPCPTPAPPAPPLPQAQNDCCSKCAEPCRYQTRKVLGTKTAQTGDKITPHRNINAKCNSEELKKIMRLGMVGETRDSKHAIQRLAQEKLGGRFSVICTSGDFSYIVNTNYFCQVTQNNQTCYAFQAA